MVQPTEIRPQDVTSVDNEGIWPVRRSRVIDWLINETSNERYIDNIIVALCDKLVEAGVALDRCSVHFRTHHPQWHGARVLWRLGMTEAKITTFAYGVENSPQFVNSPINAVFQGAAEVRTELEELDEFDDYYAEFKQQGYTEYVAWPMHHTFGRRHVATFVTKRVGGFRESDIIALKDVLPALTLVTEIRTKNILARTMLETYVGPHASEQVLAGAITRGSGSTVSAAIMICDLRGFTHISDMWPRDDVIELLNAYFDAISEPIERHGGEILKFMGDGLLAIFPLDKDQACLDLLQAIREGREAINALNDANRDGARPHLDYGVGVHIGDVMYGNIGSRKRLDFTVIGPAVNIASRLETLTKQVKRPVLLSRAFVDMAGCEDIDRLGSFLLTGLDEPVEVFALR
ncbi:adenylate/guanylate cyclase domain-containing protein [Oryzifoliimicrobium ureilyticus]|uniref:adenylate/guanylate cyclase domain-containing protein n=1 Tax=Oryzifoliimicrobium ureilyticus TaxID=3113724 RepID=UPI003076527A